MTLPLLARLRASDAARARAGGEGALRASVLEHLKNICRTRRGTMLARPDFGLPDVGELVHSFPEALTRIRDALAHNIEVYEPRLRNVRITHVPSTSAELLIRFEIRGTLVDAHDAPVRFETQMNATRVMDVV